MIAVAEAWKVGDLVECIEAKPETSHAPLVTPLKVGLCYCILGVRDADLGPPKGEIPHEIRLQTDTNDDLRLSMWYSSYRFKRVK
jgi:hypothetical protein